MNPKPFVRFAFSAPTLNITGFVPALWTMKRPMAPRGSVVGDRTTFESVSVTWIDT